MLQNESGQNHESRFCAASGYAKVQVASCGPRQRCIRVVYYLILSGLILSGNSIRSGQVLCSTLFRTSIFSSDFLLHPKRRIFSTIKNHRRCTRSDVLTEQESRLERRSEIKYTVRTFYLCYSRVRPHPADFGCRINGTRQDPSRQYRRRYSAVLR